MAIKNYTSSVDVYTSLGEIQGALASHGARKIMVDYDQKGQPVGIMFAIETLAGSRGFSLPANVEGVRAVFAKQKVKAAIGQAIRAMTDEQLATTMLSIACIGDQIDFCLYKPECEQRLDTNDDIPDEWCHACMLRWLRTPEKAGDPNG